jgi:hypothetical protein
VFGYHAICFSYIVDRGGYQRGLTSGKRKTSAGDKNKQRS